MTKQINTGVAELLLLLLPEGVTECQPRWIEGKDVLQQLRIAVYGSTIDIELPDGNWEELGVAHELTEEVWDSVLPSYSIQDEFDYMRYDNLEFCETATESGLSLLRANECYAVNPYGRDEPEGIKHIGVFAQLMRQKHKLWNEAQQNTGKWILLRKL